jgi:tubulin polyglutamylase TTLL6/13
MYNLAKKNQLGLNLERMRKKIAKEYKFYPKTWILPSDKKELRSFFSKCPDEDSEGGGLRTFIVKPEGSCQGRGIYLTRSLDRILDEEEPMVVQKYIANPYLINGLKFDLRIYVVLVGIDPLRIFIYKEGLVRFATEEYCRPNDDNLDNLYMHLTNYAINKRNKAVF